MLKRASGFTIVELLIVIVIIAVLAAITVVAYTGIQNRARTSALQSDLHNAATKIGLDKAKTDLYPLSLSAVDDGKGVTKGADTIFQYTSDGTSYCLTATSKSPGISAFHISNTDALSTGLCSGHLDGSIVANQPTDCPTGFIPVPGNSSFGTDGGFCVMKYEAKNVGGVATSQAASTPWAGLTQASAISTSQAACAGCHLMTEAEWMTIAANVLSVASNWTGGSAGNGSIYAGHNDNVPASAIAASATDSDGYSGTGNTSPSTQRRTLTLTNNEVIWDLAGNLREWTNATITGAQPSNGSAGYAWRQYTAITNWGNLPNDSRPSVAGAGSWNTSQGIGGIYSNKDETAARAFVRGGFYDNGTNAGVLALALATASTGVDTSIGFRAAR